MRRARGGLGSSARVARLVAAAGATMLLAACTAISGLDQLTFDGAGGAGGSSSGSQSASSAGTGAGGGALVEDCLNGKDDDHNGLVDCKDPACAAYECDTPPGGWLGPIAFYVGPDDSVTCPPELPMQALIGGTAAAIPPMTTCSACTCDTTPCGPLVALTYLDGSCTDGDSTVSVTPSTCIVAPPATGLRVIKPPTTNEACSAGGGTPTSTPPPGFADHAIGCAPSSVGKGCANGVCAPKTKKPFGLEACVYQPGATMCPAGYAKATVVMTALDDTRGCAPCLCGPPSQHCNLSVRFYSDATCTDDTGGVAGNICFAPGVGPNYLEVTDTSPCAATGGGPIGGVVAKTPVTVCCP